MRKALPDNAYRLFAETLAKGNVPEKASGGASVLSKPNKAKATSAKRAKSAVTSSGVPSDKGAIENSEGKGVTPFGGVNVTKAGGGGGSGSGSGGSAVSANLSGLPAVFSKLNGSDWNLRYEGLEELKDVIISNTRDMTGKVSPLPSYLCITISILFAL